MQHKTAVQIARNVEDVTSLIAVANRELLLSREEAAAAAVAALDFASAALLAQAQVRQTGPAEAFSDEVSGHLTALLDAARSYVAMRRQDGALERDAGAGGMTGALFAQALCHLANIPACPACGLLVGPQSGHFCAQARGEGRRALGMSASYDPLSGVVVIGQDDRGDVRLPLAEFLRRCNISPDDLQQLLSGAGTPAAPARANWKIRQRGTELYSTGGSSPRFTKAGKTWATRHHLMAHLRTYAECAAWRERKSKPRDDAGLLQYLPGDWEIVAFPVDVVPAMTCSLAGFLASRAGR